MLVYSMIDGNFFYFSRELQIAIIGEGIGTEIFSLIFTSNSKELNQRIK